MSRKIERKSNAQVLSVRVAIVTSTLSHFEVPLFRMASNMFGIDVNVFHCDPEEGRRFDNQHQTMIEWGEELRSGYANSFHDSVPSLVRAVFDWMPNVVLLYGYGWTGALDILLQARLRRIHIVHRGLTSIYSDPRSPHYPNLRRAARNVILKRFDAHHFGGDYSRRVLADIGVSSDRCYFVPFSVDTPYFERTVKLADSADQAEALRKRLGWSADAPVILFLGNNAWVKGPDIFIEAAALAQRVRPELKAIVIGSGPMHEVVRAQAAEALAPGTYHFEGFVPSKSTVPYYLAADLTLFPSRYDTWARAVNESMICKRPCITSQWVAASGGLVRDGSNGYVVPSLAPAEYAQRLLEFFNLPAALRRRMGELAHAQALEFSYEAHADDLHRSLTEM